MREIKFRVWTGESYEYNIMAGFLGAFYVAGIDENDSASMSVANTKYEDCHLEQYTGLKDKNGKEIYEGDIVRCYYEDDCTQYDDHMVIWCGEDCPAFDLKPSADVDGNGLSYYKAVGFIEIIGNIHD